jgi:hypothetical protein
VKPTDKSFVEAIKHKHAVRVKEMEINVEQRHEQAGRKQKSQRP